MSEQKNDLTVFTKPWVMPMPEMATLIKGLGFDGVELAVRPGYQVEPENIARDLPEAAKILADHGLKIGSIASPTDEPTIAACGEAGIPIIRICVNMNMEIGYLASEKKIQEGFDSLVPVLEKHGVAIGVQNHCDYCVGSAMGILHLIEKYNPKQICAVLDMAHCAVDGEPEDMAMDIVWDRMGGLINFKSAFHRRVNGPEELEAKYAVHWSTCHHSGYSWSRAVDVLKRRSYAGDICLPAEYSDLKKGGQLMGMDVIRPLKIDMAYIKQLLAGAGGEVEAGATDWQSNTAHGRK